MMLFEKERVNFCDYKLPNQLISYYGYMIKYGDFGVSKFYEGLNKAKGASKMYALEEFYKKMIKK